MKYWCIDPCLDPSCASFCPCDYDLKYLFPIKGLLHWAFVFCVSLSESSSSHVLTTSISLIHPSPSLEQMGKRQERLDESKRLRSPSGRLAFQIDIFSMIMAKWPQSFLLAAVWITSLESHSVAVSYLCSREDVHRKQRHRRPLVNNVWFQVVRTVSSDEIKGVIQSKAWLCTCRRAGVVAQHELYVVNINHS